MNAIYLCKPNGTFLGIIDGIEETSAVLHQSVADTWELTFDVHRFIQQDNELKEVDYYNSIGEMMELYLKNDEVEAYFQIDSDPEVTGDGTTEYKTVVAHSIETELSKKVLHNFQINTGLAISQENLVGYTDDNDGFINLNMSPYTLTPIDYITVHCTLDQKMEEIYNYLSGVNLNVNSSNGLIQNRSLYPYLNDIYQKYPRITNDVQEDGETVKVYMSIMDNPNRSDYGYDIYVGCDTYYDEATGTRKPVSNVYSGSYLVNGIRNLMLFYQKYGNQLSLIALAIENASAAGWTVGDIPQDIADKKYSFNVEEQDILSFLKTDFSGTAKVVVDFDRINKRVNIIDVVNEDDEHDTGVLLSYRNLINSVSVTEANEDGMITKFIPTGANDLGITYVNFGENNIQDLDWLIDKAGEADEYQYVSKELHDKYHRWKDYIDGTPVTYYGKWYDSRRNAYIDLTKQYNQKLLDISEIMGKVPTDGCQIDYLTASFEELNLYWKAYYNALEVLESMYFSDYGVRTFNRDTHEIWDYNGNKITDVSKRIENTIYWLDFNCYWNYIIPNVENALKKYVWTDGTLDLKTSDPRQYDASTGNWIPYTGGNPWYNNNTSYITKRNNDGYKYDMSLYGMTELQAKKQAWEEAAASAFKLGFVLYNGKPISFIPDSGYTYNTPDETGWNRLSEAQKDTFTTMESYIRGLNQYLDYVSPYVRENTLLGYRTIINSSSSNMGEVITVGVQSKGVIVLAQEAIDALQPEIDTLNSQKDVIQARRKALAKNCLIDNYSEFTEEDLTVLHILLREADYSNENILTTNLDNIVTTVDAQKELLEDAKIALSERARPQLSFTIGTDNLFALEDFEPIRDSVKLLNYIRVSIGLFHDSYTKLRIVDIERNPLIPSEALTLTFSNMSYSLQGVDDLGSIFGDMAGSGSRGSGGSGGGSFGANDAEIQLSNNILNALLKSKQYSNAVGTIMVNQIANENGYPQLMAETGIFDKLYTGDVKISGDCLVDYVKSSNYDGGRIFLDSATEGSFIDLKYGRFNLGGGKIIWDGTRLEVKAGNIDEHFEEIDETTDALDEYIKTIDAREADDYRAAMSSAASAATQAENARQAAVDAAKVATNYLAYDSSNGLVLAQNAKATSLGYNTQVKSGGVWMRYNTNVYASVTTSGLTIYGGNTSNILANFGTSSKIGTSSSYNVTIDSSNIAFNYQNNAKVEISSSGMNFYMHNGVYNYASASINSAGIAIRDRYGNVAGSFGTDSFTYGSTSGDHVAIHNTSISVTNARQTNYVTIGQSSLTIHNSYLYNFQMTPTELVGWRNGNTHFSVKLESSGAAVAINGTCKVNGYDVVTAQWTLDDMRGTLSASQVPDLSATKITSGTLKKAVLPSLGISDISGLQSELNNLQNQINSLKK